MIAHHPDYLARNRAATRNRDAAESRRLEWHREQIESHVDGRHRVSAAAAYLAAAITGLDLDSADEIADEAVERLVRLADAAIGRAAR